MALGDRDTGKCSGKFALEFVDIILYNFSCHYFISKIHYRDKIFKYSIAVKYFMINAQRDIKTK